MRLKFEFKKRPDRRAVVTGKYAALLILLGLLLAGPAASDDLQTQRGKNNGWSIESWTLQTSLYTTHFDPEPDHVNDQNLLAVETYFDRDWLAGLALFDNSFGQKSQLLYLGKTWPLLNSSHWYTKLTGGLLHGYKEPYEDKIPLNDLGVAPAIVPTLGLRYKRVFTEMQILGTAALTWTVGFNFGHKKN